MPLVMRLSSLLLGLGHDISPSLPDWEIRALIGGSCTAEKEPEHDGTEDGLEQWIKAVRVQERRVL